MIQNLKSCSAQTSPFYSSSPPFFPTPIYYRHHALKHQHYRNKYCFNQKPKIQHGSRFWTLIISILVHFKVSFGAEFRYLDETRVRLPCSTWWHWWGREWSHQKKKKWKGNKKRRRRLTLLKQFFAVCGNKENGWRMILLADNLAIVGRLRLAALVEVSRLK